MKCVSLSVRFFSLVFIFLFSVVSLFAFPLCTTGHLGDLSFVTQTAALPVVANRLPPTQNLLLPPRRKQWKSTRPTQVVRQKDDVRFEQWLLIVRLTCCVSLSSIYFLLRLTALGRKSMDVSLRVDLRSSLQMPAAQETKKDSWKHKKQQLPQCSSRQPLQYGNFVQKNSGKLATVAESFIFFKTLNSLTFKVQFCGWMWTEMNLVGTLETIGGKWSQRASLNDVRRKRNTKGLLWNKFQWNYLHVNQFCGQIKSISSNKTNQMEIGSNQSETFVVGTDGDDTSSADLRRNFDLIVERLEI